MGRPTIAEIDLGNLLHNLECIRGYLKSGTEILAVVKANAYGHGAVKVTSRLIEGGVSRFGVATVEEGAELRDGGVAEDITILGGVLPDQLEEAVSMGLNIVISSMGHLEGILKEANRIGKKVGVHIKIDSGMGRLGIFPEELEKAMKLIEESDYIVPGGIMTHLSSADGMGSEDVDYTRIQLERFDGMVGDLKFPGISLHVLNSAGIVRFSQYQYDLVRPGITLYGSLPHSDFEGIGLLPVMSLVTKIYYVKDFPSGSHISYGRKYTTTGRGRIGVLPVGYADGLRKVLSPGLEVFVEGKPSKVLGAICMDNVMIDLTDIPSAMAGSEVLIFGQKWGVTSPVEKVAEGAGTIPYEIVTSISSRVPRIFRN